MAKDHIFDTELKKSVKNSVVHIKGSSNNFDEAWARKNERESVKRLPHFSPKLKTALSVPLSILLVFTILFVNSPDARAIVGEVYDNIKTIFGLKIEPDGYSIVEKPADTKLSPIYTTTLFSDQVVKTEEKLGFKFYLPETIGKNYQRDTMSLGLNFRNVGLEDLDYLQSKAHSAIFDDGVYDQLKDYEKYYSVTGYYNNSYVVGIDKASLDQLRGEYSSLLEEIELNDIKCQVIEEVFAASSDNDLYKRITKKPTKVIRSYTIQWEYNGLNYYAFLLKHSHDDAVDLEELKQFTEDYIKDLKQAH